MSVGKIVFLCLCGVMFVSCDAKKSVSPSSHTKDTKPWVVATTTMLADMTSIIGGDLIKVHGIMGAGGDPHTYQPRPSDAKKVVASKMVVTNGLHLEGWVDDLVRHSGGTRPVVVATKGMDPIRMKGSPGGVDPHVWFDVKMWSKSVDHIAQGIMALVSSKDASLVQARAKKLEQTLLKLDAWARSNLATIPKEERVLITSHDAFNYFGRAYDVEVVGIQGVSTEQEAGQRDVANVIELVKSKKVRAIFIETSVNPSLIKQVAKETGVKVLGPLFSDSTAPKGSAGDTYMGMIVENVRIITQGLGGTYTPFAHTSFAYKVQ